MSLLSNIEKNKIQSLFNIIYTNISNQNKASFDGKSCRFATLKFKNKKLKKKVKCPLGHIVTTETYKKYKLSVFSDASNLPKPLLKEIAPEIEDKNLPVLVDFLEDIQLAHDIPAFKADSNEQFIKLFQEKAKEVAKTYELSY
jgi:hypothetical protein